MRLVYGGMITSPSIPDDDQAIQLAEMFRLMGDPSRLRIIIACLQAPICVSDLAARTRQ
jgi:hypothetical protein